MLKCCYAIFWMYGSKNILFMFPLFKKPKNHKFSNFSDPGSRKVLTSEKIMIFGQKCFHHLIQDSLKYLCAQFGYDWTKKRYGKEGVEGGGSNGPPPLPTYLTSKKPNPCRVKGQNMLLEEKWTLLRFSSFRFCSITKTKNSKISESFLLLQILIAAVIYSKFIFCF